VRGSGGASDLLADVVIITDALSSEDKELNSKDQAQDKRKVLNLRSTLYSDLHRKYTRALTFENIWQVVAPRA
jgi:hypothetical protein